MATEKSHLAGVGAGLAARVWSRNWGDFTMNLGFKLQFVAHGVDLADKKLFWRGWIMGLGRKKKPWEARSVGVRDGGQAILRIAMMKKMPVVSPTLGWERAFISWALCFSRVKNETSNRFSLSTSKEFL